MSNNPEQLDQTGDESTQQEQQTNASDKAPPAPPPQEDLNVWQGNNPNVTMERSPIDSQAPHGKKNPLFTLSMSLDDFQKHAGRFPSFKVRGNYVDAIGQGAMPMMRTDVLNDTTTREGSDWQQTVEYERMQYGLAQPRPDNGSGKEITGENAVLMIQKALGLGTRATVPLWHSGLWLTLNTPTDAELLNLERQIQEEKISLGKDTAGTLYSNNLVYIVRHVFRFILDHIHSSTLADSTPEKLSKLIRVTDLPTILWAMSCTIYPNGFDHSRPCTVNPDKCQHIAEGRINLAKLSFTDRSALTMKQKKHMANRIAKYTEEQILDYQNEGRIGDGKTFDLADSVSVVLRIPTVEEYVESGMRWIDSIINIIEESLSASLGDKERDAYVAQHGRLASLRQYGHWVKKITHGGSVEITDRESIEDLLDKLSSSDDLVTIYLENIKDYISSSTVSIIAIPAYKCPNCQGQMSGDDLRHPHLIQLDALMTFFTLKDLRLLRVKS